MKLNINIILIAIIAAVVGLAAGYFIFGNNKETVTSPESHIHEEESMETVTSAQTWTCSMHPQVRQNEPGLCPICGMDLIPVEKSISDDPLVLVMTKEAVKLANIQTTTVGLVAPQDGKMIRLSGKVQADERLAASQVAHIPGRIEKLYVTFTGEQVNKGQKLAVIYSPELITAQTELIEALKIQDINPGLLNAARNKLKYWKIGDSTIEEIEKNGVVKEVFTLHADESGIVTNRRVSVGDYIKLGEPLFNLMNLRKVWVLFDAYEEDLASISLADRIEFTTPSIPNKIFRTNITFIDPVINPNTRVATLRTEVNNANGLLKPEMFVNGNLHKNVNSKTQLTVPKSAVLWTGIRSVVYVKMPDSDIPSFQFREVELGEGLGDRYQLLSGLEAGEEIVTYGSFTIDAAAQLNNQASMMNKNVMIKGADQMDHLPDYTESTPVAFKHQLAEVTNAYLALKDAFVAADNFQANKDAQAILEALSVTDMSLIKGNSHIYWMEKLNALTAHSEKITELSDVEEQRKQFDFLSQSLIETIKVFGIPEDTFYVSHCPMAFNNVGADWISDATEIRNPYFGDKMLKCGLVKDTINKDYKNPPMGQASMTQPRVHNH
jgi:Cu(I)/Ag(I) efflux system membrane fusion protein